MLAIPGYTISRQIHDGRRSQIFQGRREMDNLPVIIKTLKNKLPLQSEKFRFQQEYNILQALEPYGVVQAYAMEKFQNTSAIVMEDAGGISLDRFRDIGKIKLSELMSLFIRIAEIVDDIHQQSIVHKDINPTNIVWNRETNQVKITDNVVELMIEKIKKLPDETSRVLKIEIQAKDHDFCITYKDNGKGMDEKTIKKIYDPFYTTKRSHGGTGLGMHLVYNLVTQTMGGIIECMSTPGEGTTFTINFPY